MITRIRRSRWRVNYECTTATQSFLSPVILSEAKDLCIPAQQTNAYFLRFAQNDRDYGALPMTFENILLEKKNSIAYVTVNRPKPTVSQLSPLQSDL